MPGVRDRWAVFSMARSGLTGGGRLATRLAALAEPAYKGKRRLAQLSRRGYVSPRAQISCRDLRLGAHCYIDDDVVIFDRGDGGYVMLGDGVHLYKGSIIELGRGGCVEIGPGSHIQPNCQFTAFVGAVRIGREVQVAPACAFYPYEHGIVAGQPIHKQPLHTRGDIVIGDGAWLGYGVIVLNGVTIGPGAVVGAGAVVTRDVPDNHVAAGVPAKIMGPRPEQNADDADLADSQDFSAGRSHRNESRESARSASSASH